MKFEGLEIMSRLLALALSGLVLGLAIFYLILADDPIEVAKDQNGFSPPLVSVELVEERPQRLIVEAFSDIKPRWSADVSAAVSGRVLEVTNKALAGEHVKQGTILARVESARYESEVAAAKVALKEAELALWQARNANLLAEKQFHRDGRKAPNKLALKLPQLEIAQSRLNQAQAQLKSAEQQLADCVISAPFSGYVTERTISPGQSVNVGDKLLTLLDDSVYELAVSLSVDNWILLEHPLKDQTAAILDADGAEIAVAQIRQAGGFLDDKTRQNKIFLQVTSQTSPRIQSGDFVKVAIAGKVLPRALSINESARTREGYVWYVDLDDRLQRFAPQILQHRDGRLVFRAPEGMAQSSWRIVETPLASFLPGQKVKPKVIKPNSVLKNEADDA